MTQQEKDDVPRLWQKPHQATALEQNQHGAQGQDLQQGAQDQKITNEGQGDQPKLQFTAEADWTSGQDAVKQPPDLLPDQRQVADDEPVIEVLLGDAYDLDGRVVLQLHAPYAIYASILQLNLHVPYHILANAASVY